MGRWFDMAVQKGQLGAVRSERGLTAPNCANCTDTSPSNVATICMICGGPANDSNSNLLAHPDGDERLLRLHIAPECYRTWFERAFGRTPKPEVLTIAKLPKP